jgi:hypothetical protein
MFRLLQQQQRMNRNVDDETDDLPIVELEEVPGKQHWWWDTGTDNDGGAVNDIKVALILNVFSAQYISSYFIESNLE